MTTRRPFIARIDGARRFQISCEVLEVVQSYRQQGPRDTEAGGLLAGRCLRDGGHLIVDLATEPGPTDERTRYGFNRVDPSHQERLDRAWEESEGTCAAIGSWHTHAEPHPTPSDVDLDAWRDHAATWTWDGDALYFAIVGTESVGVWEVDRAGTVRRLLPLGITTEEIGEMRQQIHENVVADLAALGFTAGSA